MANSGVCSIVSFCPECGETRGGIDINKAILRALLSRECDIRVRSAACGHAWTLPADEKADLKHALSKGFL